MLETLPALKVKLMAQMVAVTLSTMQKPFDVQRKLSISVRNSGFSVGMTLFPMSTSPGAPTKYGARIRVQRKEIEARSIREIESYFAFLHSWVY